MLSKMPMVKLVDEYHQYIITGESEEITIQQYENNRPHEEPRLKNTMKIPTIHAIEFFEEALAIAKENERLEQEYPQKQRSSGIIA